MMPELTTVEPGVNTLSKAVYEMMNFDKLIVRPGEYIQNEPIVFPPNVSNFSICGSGMGSTKIHLNGVDGFVQTNRVIQCEISHLAIVASHKKTAIKLMGSTHNHVICPNIILSDISISAAMDSPYEKGIEITDAYNPVLRNVNVRGTHDLRGVGIEFISCVEGSISGGELAELDYGIIFSKADENIIDGENKYGCEGTRVVGTEMYRVNKGITLGERSLSIKMLGVSIDPCFKYALQEEINAPYTGYHKINGCSFGYSYQDAELYGHLIFLKNPGTIVIGSSIGGSQIPVNGITISKANNTIVNGNIFRFNHSGVYLHNGSHCVISNNVGENIQPSGSLVAITPQSHHNKLVGNIGNIKNRGNYNTILG
jgi:parallel beta-helix repeat protein